MYRSLRPIAGQRNADRSHQITRIHWQFAKHPIPMTEPIRAIRFLQDRRRCLKRAGRGRVGSGRVEDPACVRFFARYRWSRTPVGRKLHVNRGVTSTLVASRSTFGRCSMPLRHNVTLRSGARSAAAAKLTHPALAYRLNRASGTTNRASWQTIKPVSSLGFYVTGPMVTKKSSPNCCPSITTNCAEWPALTCGANARITRCKARHRFTKHICVCGAGATRRE